MSVQMQCTVEVCRNGCPNACDNANYPPPQHILKPKISFNQSPPNRKNGNRQELNRGNSRRNQNKNNYDHSRDLVLDDDTALTASESNHQPAAILPLENHRRVLDEESNLKENLNPNNLPAVNSLTINNENDMKLNNDQIQQLITTTTSKPIYRLTEDALQHENNKLISELKYAGVDMNRLNSLADTLLNNKQSNSNLDNLPSLTSHIQRLQNDHLAQVLKDERLRELALESGLKLSGLQLNELLPQAQPLKTNNDNSSLNNHHNAIDFDSLLNSVNNLISSSTISTSTVPFIQTSTTTSTTTQSPVTENKDVYLEEETSSDDINIANTPDDLNDSNTNLVKQNENQDQVNVRILNNHQDNQFKHQPLSPKNQPSYIIENTPPKPVHHQPNHNRFNYHINIPNKPLQINHKPSVAATSIPQQPNLQLNNNNNKNKNHQLLNNKLPSINYQTGPSQLHHQPNLIQPLINHQHHHQPFHFQYLPTTFNSLPLNTLPASINLNNINSLNALPINLLTNAQLSSQLQTPVIKPATAVKQTNKLANLFKQNSLTQYVNTLFKKDASNPAASLLSLFSPATNRALRVNRVSRNARMQIPNKLALIKLKKTEPSAEQNKIRLRRSTGSHVNLKQEFQVVTPLEMQFNNDNDFNTDFNSELNQPELLKGKSQINETKSLICLELKSTLILALLSAVFLFIILILTCIFMLKRYKKLESN